jgi:hypothetical protein
MRADYDRAITDEELMSLRSDIAVLDARITDLLARADSGESGRLWRQLAAQMRAVDVSVDPESAKAAMTKLQQIIQDGDADWMLWDEIREALLSRERLVRSERKRLVEAKLVIPLEQAQLMMAIFVDAAKEAVGHDERAMVKIVEAFVRLTGHADAYDVADGAIEAGGLGTQAGDRPDG